MAQNPNAILAQNVHSHFRPVLAVYLAWIIIWVLVYAPNQEMM